MSEAPEDVGHVPQDQQYATTSFPLLVYLDGLVGDLRGRIPVALGQWDAEAIHQSRVATRRMKAALDLMRPVLGRRARRRFGRVMRNLRRRLGPLRDADVMIDHLQDIRSEGKYADAIDWLSARLCREREALRLRSAKRRPPEAVLDKLKTWEPVRREVAAAHEAVDSLLAESLHLQLDMFAEQADRLIAGRDRSRAASPQDPHELRISGKALRYTLEMAGVQGHDLPGSLTKTFKKMQDALGLWHDYVVLAERAARAGLDDQLAHHEPERMTEVLELVRDALGRATHHLDSFKRQWSAEGETVGKAIRTSFPLTHPTRPQRTDAPGDGAQGPAGLSGSQTDRGPRGSGSQAGPEGCPPAAASDA